MNTPKVLIISQCNQAHRWLDPMLEAGIDAQIVSADDGLAAAQIIAPDLLIFDVTAGRSDGVSWVERVRSDADMGSVLIILFSHNADERERTAGLDAGADDYLTGQISARELIARIRAVMRRGNFKP